MCSDPQLGGWAPGVVRAPNELLAVRSELYVSDEMLVHVWSDILSRLRVDLNIHMYSAETHLTRRRRLQSQSQSSGHMHAVH